MFFDRLVHQGLRDGGIVDFAVPVAAVTDEVDNDVGAEAIAIIDGESRDANDCVNVFGVYVEDRNRLTAGKLGREARGVLFTRAGGESEQVVDDDVNGAADGVACEIRVVDGLGQNTLACEGGVAVNEERQEFLCSIGASAVVLGARAAHGHRIDGFKMARVGNEVDVNLRAALGRVLAGGADVIFDVSAAEYAARIDVFKLSKNFFGLTLGDVNDHVEAPAVAHAEDEFLRAELTGGVEKLVHQGKKRRVAFEREAFVAEIARLKDLLKQFGPDQVVENALLIDGGGSRLHVIGEPAAALRIGNVGELDADAAAINASRFLRDFALGGQFRMRLGRRNPRGSSFASTYPQRRNSSKMRSRSPGASRSPVELESMDCWEVVFAILY